MVAWLNRTLLVVGGILAVLYLVGLLVRLGYLR